MSDAPQRDSGMNDRDQEHRQPVVLGHIPVSAGQTQPVVGGKGTGAPRLCAVDHPAIALAVGAGEHTGQVRSPAGFTQQLHQHLVAAQRRRDVLLLLLLAAGVEQRRATDRERRRVEDQRHLVISAFLVERLLILVIQTQPTVFAGKADTGETAVVEPLLQFPGSLPRALVVAMRGRRGGRVDARHVLGQPNPGPGAELLDGLGHHADLAASFQAYTARLCSSGVPNMERYNATRRRYRCRSCSQVTPIPPCICTQPCTICGDISPT